jgi:hypothetical protein
VAKDDKKLRPTENKATPETATPETATDVETKKKAEIEALWADFGKLQAQREVLTFRLEQTTERMKQIRIQLDKKENK